MKTPWSRQKKIFIVAYAIVLLGMTIATMLSFNKLTFGALFVLIALWPVGQFFINRKS